MNLCSWRLKRAALNALNVLFVSFLLAGCAMTEEVVRPVEVKDTAVEALEHSARQVASSLVALGQITQALNPNPVLPPARPAAGDRLMTLISLSGVWPLETALDAVCGRAGVPVRVLGRKPDASLFVTVRADRTPLFDVLRDLGAQVGDAAGIVVSGGAVELHYAPIRHGASSQGSLKGVAQ